MVPISESRAGTEWQRDDYETDQILNRAAVQHLLAQPVEFVRKFVTGLFTFWYEMTSLTNSLLAGGLALARGSLPSSACAARRVRVGRLDPHPTGAVPEPSPGRAAGAGRYSVPILPPLLVVSAFRHRHAAEARSSERMPELAFRPGQLKAIIFDLDGTLYRQSSLRATCWSPGARPHVPSRTGVRTLRRSGIPSGSGAVARSADP